MRDIVERLRDADDILSEDAADEIVRLRTELALERSKHLREANRETLQLKV